MAHHELDFRTYMIRFFLPIIACLILVFILSQSTLNFYFNVAQTPPPPATPVQPNESGSNQAEVGLANMLLYVVMAFIGGVVILSLMRRGFFSFVQVLFGGILGFSAFILGLFFYSLVLADFFNLTVSIFPFLQNQSAISTLSWVYVILVFGLSIISGILGFVVMINVHWVPMIVRNGMIVLFGATVGSYLGIHFPVLSAVFVLIGLAIYDIYAVFKGPLKGILSEIGISADASSPPEKSHPHSNDQNQEAASRLIDLSTETMTTNSLQANSEALPDHSEPSEESVNARSEEEGGEASSSPKAPQAHVASIFPGLPIYSDGIISIGLGDFAFYSMLVAHSMKITWLLDFNPIPLMLTLLGVLAGAFITLRWLVKQKVLPGLPMAIFLGIMGLFLGIIIAIPNVDQIQWLLAQ